MSDETVSIIEFLEAATEQSEKAGKENVKPIINTLLKEGIDLNQPWLSLANEDAVSALLDSKFTTSSTFQKLQAIEREARLFYNQNKKSVENAAKYPFADDSVNIMSATGLARSQGNKEANPKAYQIRGTQKFKRVPKASITIPKILEAVQGVKDPATRAAIAFNVLIPFRPGEVADLLIEDIDFEEGYIAEYTRGKKTRAGMRIPKVALEILRDAAEDAKEKGSDKVFANVTVAKMTSALKNEGKIVELFKGSKATLGREILGVKDLRKLLPSLLAQQIDPANAKAISQIMGHEEIGAILADLNEMTTGHYVSPVDLPENAATDALEVLENMLGRNGGATTLNELPVIFNVSAKALTEEGSEVFNIPEDVQDKVIPAEKLTPAQIEVNEERAKLTKSNIVKQAAQTDLDAENIQLEVQERRIAREAKSVDVIVDEAKQKVEKQEKLKERIEVLKANPNNTSQQEQVIAMLEKQAGSSPTEKPKAPSYSSLSDEEWIKKMNSKEGLGTEYWLNKGNELKKAVTSKTAKSVAKKLAIAAITGGATAIPTVADAAVDLALDSSPTGDTPNLEDSTQAELLELLESEKTTDTREPVANFASRRLEGNLAENKAFEARRTNPETTALKEDMDKVFGKKPLAEVIDKRDKESLDTSTRKIEEGLAKYNNSPLLKEYSGFATRP